jgi:aminomethyltransferase
MANKPKKTSLYDLHLEQGGKMIEFAGYILPVQYSGIIEEHIAVRERVGIFDISHMGEFIISGEDSPEFTDYLLTNSTEKLEIGHIAYSPMCLPDGGIVDDLLCYRLDEMEYMLVVNATNKEKNKNWINENLLGNTDFRDISDDITLIAVQGPESEEALTSLTNDIDLSKIRYYWWDKGIIAEQEVLISRTGYTGEDGFEIYIDKNADPVKIYKSIMNAGSEFGIMPVGLGARDTLRLEKKYCLYGNDIDETTSPLEAGLEWTIKFDKIDFIGKDALVLQKEQGIKRKLIGFKMLGNAIPRKGYRIFLDDRITGEVTSGSFSPSLSCPIGLGYVSIEDAEIGTDVEIEIRSNKHPATIVKTPFI